MTDERIIEEAHDWVVALKRDDADWDGFTRWLEASSPHRAAFDEMALLDGRVAQHRDTLATVLPADERPRRANRKLWAWGGGGGALAVAAVAGLLLLPTSPEAADQIYRTGRGQTRQIALADGSAVQLASASQLTVAGDSRRLALDGTASFIVPHRPDRTMTIQAGGLTIQDIGTSFEVATGARAVRVAVAEGEVSVAAPELASPVQVTHGKRLLVDRAQGVAEIGGIREYASWRHGRLVYDNAPLPLVAAEVGRYSGRRLALDPGLSGRRFSGVLKISDGSGLVDDLAHLMDLDARSEGSAVVLVARSDGR